MIEDIAKNFYSNVRRKKIIELFAQLLIVAFFGFFAISSMVYLFTGHLLMEWPDKSSGREFVLLILHVAGTIFSGVFVVFAAGLAQ